MIEIKEYHGQKSSPSRPQYNGDVTFRSYGRMRHKVLRFKGGSCEWEPSDKEMVNCAYAYAPLRTEILGKNAPVVMGTITKMSHHITFRGELLTPDDDVLLIKGFGGTTGSRGQNIVSDHVLHMTKIKTMEQAAKTFKEWVNENLGDQVTAIIA